MQLIKKNSRGFSLVELLVALALFVLVATAIYQGYGRVMQVVRLARTKTLATALANEQLEIVRNMPYSDVGLVGGIPVGKLIRSKSLVRDGVTFYATTTIRNIDDPFDGVIDGSPDDLSPADYKLVAIDIDCPSCVQFTPLEFTTTVAPRGLETTSTNGALFVKVFDASGQPIVGAQVSIQNASVTPTIAINEVTNTSGFVQIIDAPPSVDGYRITVTKAGYSTEQTYMPGLVGNPNPVKPHATVVLQQVTQSSFAIDRLSVFNISSVDLSCNAVGSVGFSLTGSKLIGTSPNVPKVGAQNYTTSAGGSLTLSSIEWDTYTLALTGTTKYIAGTIPTFPLSVQPNSSNNITLITVPKVPGAALFTIQDGATGLPISGATVQFSSGSYNETKTTGQGYKRQTDWSGGAGQADFADETKYLSSDGNIDVTAAGTIKLATLFGNYVADGSLVSSTFDLATSSNMYELTWQPGSQPGGTGANAVRFQIASNNDNATWDFKGPDGTAATYYTTSGQSISSVHNGSRYVRYKIFLHTDTVTVTPTVSDISFTYSSLCAPPGQVYFDSLSGGTYSVLVQKAGYANSTASVSISGSGYTNQVISMNP